MIFVGANKYKVLHTLRWVSNLCIILIQIELFDSKPICFCWKKILISLFFVLHLCRLNKNLGSRKGSRTGNSGNYLELQVLTQIQYVPWIPNRQNIICVQCPFQPKRSHWPQFNTNFETKLLIHYFILWGNKRELKIDEKMVHAQRFANNRSGSTFGNQLKSTEASKGQDFWTQPKQNGQKNDMQSAFKSSTATHNKSGSTTPASSNNWGPFKNREDFVNMHHCWAATSTGTHCFD